MKSNQRLDYSGLAEILGQSGLVEPERLAVALQTCAQGGGAFPELLIDNGMITDWELARVVCELYGLPFLPVEMYSPENHASEGLDLEFLRTNNLIAMERHGQLLTLCMPVLVPAEILGFLSAQTNLNILPVVGTVTGNRNWYLENAASPAASTPTPAATPQVAAEDETPELEDVPAPIASAPGDDEAISLLVSPEDEITGEPDAQAEEAAAESALDEWSTFFDAADAAVNLDLGQPDPPA